MDRLNQLLRMLEASGKEERTLIDDLTQEERARMGIPNNWSFKDNVACYAVWTRRLTENLTAVAAGRPPDWKPTRRWPFRISGGKRAESGNQQRRTLC